MHWRGVLRNAARAPWLTALYVAILPFTLEAQQASTSSSPFIVSGDFTEPIEVAHDEGRTIIAARRKDEPGFSIWSLPDASDGAPHLLYHADKNHSNESPQLQRLFLDQGHIYIALRNDALLRPSNPFDLFELRDDSQTGAPLKLIANLDGLPTCAARAGERLLLGTTSGLLAIAENSSTKPVRIETPGTQISCLLVRGKYTYIGHERGVSRLADGDVTATPLSTRNVFVDAKHLCSFGDRIFIAAAPIESAHRQGLFAFSDTLALPIRISPKNSDPTMTINSLCPCGDTLLIAFGSAFWRPAGFPARGTPSEGMYLLNDGTNRCDQLKGVLEGTLITMIEAQNHRALLASNYNGLWEYSEYSPNYPAEEQISHRKEDDTSILGTTNHKLGVRCRRISVIEKDDQILAIVPAPDRFFVHAQSGLYNFRFSDLDDQWPVNCELDWNSPSQELVGAVTVRLKATLAPLNGWNDTTDSPIHVTVFKKEPLKDVAVARIDHDSVSDLIVDLPGEGTYYATARIGSALGQWSREIHTKDLKVSSSQLAFTKALLEKLAAALALFWFFFTVALIILSKWFDLPFRILTGPHIPKIAKWYAPLFEYSRAVRLWILERYYQRLRSEFNASHPFVEPTILASSGDPLGLEFLKKYVTDHFADRRPSSIHAFRLLITGPPGTGKTTLLERFLYEMTRPRLLSLSWKTYTAIPMFIRVRQYGDGDVITAIATMFERYGVEDIALIKRLLRTGDFLLIFDGANERDWDTALSSFATAFPEAALIIASQTTPQISGLQHIGLPPFDENFAKRVLKAHTGWSEKQFITKVPRELWSDVKSGYDVVLLAALLPEAGRIPNSAVGLYERTIEHAEQSWHGPHQFAALLAILYQRAFEMWKTNLYDLEPCESLPKHFLSHLVDVHILTQRNLRHQFRHDLMRNYLAACWLVKEAVSREDRSSRLEDDAIWTLGASQQNGMFPFLVELLPSDEDLQAIADSASKNVDQRSVLAGAVQNEAKKRTTAIIITLNPKIVLPPF